VIGALGGITKLTKCIAPSAKAFSKKALLRLPQVRGLVPRDYTTVRKHRDMCVRDRKLQQFLR
jgi:hypothetical protein